MPKRLKTSAFLMRATVAVLLKVTCLAVVVPRRALAGIETSRSEANLPIVTAGLVILLMVGLTLGTTFFSFSIRLVLFKVIFLLASWSACIVPVVLGTTLFVIIIDVRSLGDVRFFSIPGELVMPDPFLSIPVVITWSFLSSMSPRRLKTLVDLLNTSLPTPVILKVGVVSAKLVVLVTELSPNLSNTVRFCSTGFLSTWVLTIVALGAATVYSTVLSSLPFVVFIFLF